MYQLKGEVVVILEKQDILEFVKDVVSEDISYRLGEEIPDDYEGEFQSIQWTEQGEMKVILG